MRVCGLKRSTCPRPARFVWFPAKRHDTGCNPNLWQRYAVAEPLTAPSQVQPLHLSVVDTDDVFRSYNPDALEGYFKSRPWLLLQRVSQVAGAAGKLLFFKLQQWIQGAAPQTAEEAEGKLICSLLLQLGPTFVKLGQSLSVRPDVVGEVLSQELAQLQDSCPAFDNDTAMAIIARELSQSPQSLFSSISEQPVAAASLGQVYRATLAADGSQVAVKVQRPGMARSIALDVIALRLFLGFIRKVAGINQDIRGLADELGGALFQELDYQQEAANALRFLEAHDLLGFVDVPRARPEYSTRSVLTMDWLEGNTPAELLEAAALPGSLQLPGGRRGSLQHLGRAAAAEKLLALVQMGVECSLSQILETGVVHGDPHPGNLLLSPAGRLVYLDFGLLARVPPSMSEGLLAALLHLGVGQWDAMPDDLDKLGLLKPDTDRQALAADLKRELLKFLPQEPAAAAISGTLWRPLFADMTFGQFFGVVIRMAFKYRFKLPPYYLLVIRSVASLEGIALSVNPNFKIVAAAMPVVLRKLLTDRRPGAMQLLRDVMLRPDGQLQLGFVAYMLQQLSAPPLQVTLAASIGEGPAERTSLDASSNGRRVTQLMSSQASSVADRNGVPGSETQAQRWVATGRSSNGVSPNTALHNPGPASSAAGSNGTHPPAPAAPSPAVRVEAAPQQPDAQAAGSNGSGALPSTSQARPTKLPDRGSQRAAVNLDPLGPSSAAAASNGLQATLPRTAATASPTSTLASTSQQDSTPLPQHSNRTHTHPAPRGPAAPAAARPEPAAALARSSPQQQLEAMMFSAQASGLRRLLLSLDSRTVLRQLSARPPPPDVSALLQAITAALAAGIAAAVASVVLGPWRGLLWLVGRGQARRSPAAAAPTATAARAQARRKRLLLSGLLQRLWRAGGVLALGSVLMLVLRLLGAAVLQLVAGQRRRQSMAAPQ